MVVMSDSITKILPLEIIDHTIDIIARDDHQDHPFTSPNVKACALTCHAFLPRSRHHIFRTIKIHDANRYIPRFPPEEAPCPLASSFATLLTANPQIAGYVRELYYVFPEIGGSLSSVPPILQELTKLETFVLYSDNSGTLDWWQLHPRTRSIFLRLLHLPTITSVRLRSIHDFPPSVLFPCANLQNVYLDGVLFDEGDVSSPSRSSPSNSIKLQELELKIGRSINDTVSKISKKTTEDGKPVFDLGELKKLTTSIKCPDQVQLTAKALKHAKSVETVHLIVESSRNLGPDNVVTVDQIVSLLSPSLETLRFLNLDIHIDTPKIAPLAGVPRALNEIASEAKYIEILKIRLNVNRGVEYAHSGAHVDESEWGLLEEVLLASDHWPSLKRVDLGIFADGPSRGENWARELSQYVQMRLTRLSSRASKVEFNFFAADECKIPRTSIEKSMLLL